VSARAAISTLQFPCCIIHNFQRHKFSFPCFSACFCCAMETSNAAILLFVVQLWPFASFDSSNKQLAEHTEMRCKKNEGLVLGGIADSMAFRNEEVQQLKILSMSDLSQQFAETPTNISQVYLCKCYCHHASLPSSSDELLPVGMFHSNYLR